MEDQITRLGEGQSRLCTSSKQSVRVTESHETTPKTRQSAIAARFNTKFTSDGWGDLISVWDLKKKIYSEATNELEKQDE